MSTYAAPVSQSTTATSRPSLLRWLPLAGVGYGVVTVVGDFVVDAFPDENTPLGKLSAYYGAHHAQVGNGGTLMEVASIFVALFGAALVVRLRTTPLAAAVVGIGTAMTCLSAAYEGATFRFLGEHATGSHLSPQALQAWHLSAAGFGTNVPVLVLVIGLVVAGRALPVWLVAIAVVLAVAQFTPVAFLASMLMLLWFVVAGVALALRPAH